MSRTIAEGLADLRGRLAAAGIDSAPAEARRIMAAALQAPADRLSLMRTEPLPPEAEDRLAGLAARRCAREPLAQILGQRAFFRHEFRVTADVLDPRPETETLVEAALGAPFSRVLDLGTGSGCILLSLLAARSDARGLGTDISEPALAVARGNARALGLDGRARWQRADWFAGLAGGFDLIVSNPPYIATSQMTALAPELRRFEPRVALEGGEDGLDAYRIIVTGAAAHLSPGGRLMVEIGPTQGHAVAALFEQQGARDIHVHPDLDGRDRAVTGRWSGG